MVFEHWEHCHVLMPVDIMHILVAKPTCLLKINLKQIFRKLKVQKQMQRNYMFYSRLIELLLD